MTRVAMYGIALGLCLAAGSAPAAAQDAEVRVTIERVKNVEGGDVLSKPDFFAKVSIAGEEFTSPHIQDNDDISPNWTFTKSTPIGITGLTQVVIAIYDRDVIVHDPVDVNPMPGKKDLSLTLNVITCQVTGDVSGACRASITAGGDQKPRAEVTFRIDVPNAAQLRRQ